MNFCFFRTGSPPVQRDESRSNLRHWPVIFFVQQQLLAPLNYIPFTLQYIYELFLLLLLSTTSSSSFIFCLFVFILPCGSNKYFIVLALFYLFFLFDIIMFKLSFFYSVMCSAVSTKARQDSNYRRKRCYVIWVISDSRNKKNEDIFRCLIFPRRIPRELHNSPARSLRDLTAVQHPGQSIRWCLLYYIN